MSAECVFVCTGSYIRFCIGNDQRVLISLQWKCKSWMQTTAHKKKIVQSKSNSNALNSTKRRCNNNIEKTLIVLANNETKLSKNHTIIEIYKMNGMKNTSETKRRNYILRIENWWLIFIQQKLNIAVNFQPCAHTNIHKSKYDEGVKLYLSLCMSERELGNYKTKATQFVFFIRKESEKKLNWMKIGFVICGCALECVWLCRVEEEKRIHTIAARQKSNLNANHSVIHHCWLFFSSRTLRLFAAFDSSLSLLFLFLFL